LGEVRGLTVATPTFPAASAAQPNMYLAQRAYNYGWSAPEDYDKTRAELVKQRGEISAQKYGAVRDYWLEASRRERDLMKIQADLTMAQLDAEVNAAIAELGANTDIAQSMYQWKATTWDSMKLRSEQLDRALQPPDSVISKADAMVAAYQTQNAPPSPSAVRSLIVSVPPEQVPAVLSHLRAGGINPDALFPPGQAVTTMEGDVIPGDWYQGVKAQGEQARAGSAAMAKIAPKLEL